MSENNSSQNMDQALKSFSARNPDFLLVGANLYQNELLDSLNWEGLDRENILEKLRVYQRLMKLCNDETVIKSLLDNGFESAHHIASITEDAFATNYASALNISEEAARTIYKNAEAVKAKTMLLWANVKDVVASPYYNSMKVNNINSNITEFFEALPSYEELFGSLDYFEVDEAKSIFGAAAYFVDLMRIVDEYIMAGNEVPSEHTLDARRPDLKKILLTKENTYEAVPYLQIVNEVLVNTVKNYPEVSTSVDQNKEQDEVDVFKSFVTSKYPFNLPFNLPLEEIRTYLAQLNVKLSDVIEVFDMTEKQSIEFSREFLNMSREEYDIITTSSTDSVSLGEYFGFPENLITADDGIDKFLEKTKLNLVDVFKEKTGIDEDSITELFYLDLSEEEKVKGLLSKAYINNVPNSKGNLGIITKTDSSGVEYEEIVNLDFNKLDRINRIIRLVQKLNWSFTDLDWVLTSLKVTEIDKATITNLSAIKDMADKYKIPLKSICTLWYDIRTIGEGNDDSSEVPFDLIFNDINIVNKRKDKVVYHPKTMGNQDARDNGSFKNPFYTDELLILAVTPNAEEKVANQTLAESIVLSSIPAKGNDFKALCEFLFHGRDTINLSIPNLSALYRHASFAKLLKIKIPEYITLLNLLGKEGKDLLSIDDVAEIFETAEWMKKSKFNGYELDFITSGIENPYVSKQCTDDKVNQFITALQLSMKPAYINQKSFVSPESNIDENGSSEIFKKLVEYGLISSSGSVLLEDCDYLRFRKWNKFQYEQIFTTESKEQAKWVIDKLASQKEEEEEKLATQFAVFFGTKEEIMSAVINVGQGVLKEYGSNWVKIFEDNSSVLKVDKPSPDIIKKIMNVVSRYIILTQKLKLKGYELESIAANHFSYNISTLEKLTLNNIKSLYEYKQLSISLGDGLTSYFQAVNNATAADDITNYINKQLNDEKISMFITSLGSLMKPLYVNDKSFVSADVAIDEVLSEKVSKVLVKDGFVDPSGVVLLEEVDLNKLKTQYEVQYLELLSIMSETKIEFVVNKLMLQRSQQENMVLEELAIFFNVNLELMTVLAKITSKVLVEHIQNYAEFFMENMSLALGTISNVIKKFMAVASLYLVIARKLGIEAAELEDLFLDNGVKDIQILRNLGLDTMAGAEGFVEVINKLRDKNNTNGYEGSFALVKDERMTSKILMSLNEITGWDTEQIKELCNFFFETDTCLTVKDVSKLKTCFNMANNIGVDIYFLKNLYSCKDLPSLTGSWDVYSEYASKVLEAVKSQYSAKAWEGVYKDLNSNMELKKRDKLLTAALWKIGQIYSDIDDSRSLYKYLLLDVDMGSESQISYIKHGLNSLQLYLHRCRMKLEKGVTTSKIPEAWWEWIMSYRVWEANRKVFLYPENYLDPSLRNSKTSIFKSLEETLMQSDITAESAEEAFRKYLDEFSKVAKLRYVDSYYSTVNYPSKGEKNTLFLFAQTQTVPYDYYFCTREQNDSQGGDNATVWTEWKKIDITINSEYITPIYAFNRLFVFWVEMKEVKESNSSSKTITNKATIKYSFYNFSGDWIAPQTLVEDKVVHFDPDDYAESIKNSVTSNSPFQNQFDMDNVFWKKVYAMNVSEENYGEDGPEGTSKSEKIAIMYGPFLAITSYAGKLKTPSEPMVIKGEDKSEYESNIYSQALNYNRAIDFTEGGYLPLNDAIVINESLQKDFLLRSSEFLAIDKNKENCVFKPGIDKVKNSLYVTSSDSIIHDNYISEFASNTVDNSEKLDLFSSIFSSNAKIITVKNQPGMFIYDNGDETFLVTSYKNLFSEIKKSYKLRLPSPILRENSFVASLIDEDISKKIYKSLIKQGVIVDEGKINENLSLDKNGLLLSISLKNNSINLNEDQFNEVMGILSTTTKNTFLQKTSFISKDLSINTILSKVIYQELITEGILDTNGKVTAKYSKEQGKAILSDLLSRNQINLIDRQIDLVNNVLANSTVITENSFILTITKNIDEKLSEKIYNQLVILEIIDANGEIVDGSYIYLSFISLNEEQLKNVGAILSSIEKGISLDKTSFIIKNPSIDKTLSNVTEVTEDAFAVSINGNIDEKLSENIYNRLVNLKVIDINGKLVDAFYDDKALLIVSICVLMSGLNLSDTQGIAIEAEAKLFKNMSKAVPSSFSHINAGKANEIFINLKQNGILDSEGRVCQNINKNIDLSTILGYLNSNERKQVKDILLDLFVPVMFDYDTKDGEIDLENLNFTVTRISTGAVDRLSGRLFSGGIDKLLSLESQQEPKERNLPFKRFKPTSAINISEPFLLDGAQVDFNGPYGNYYWELFFHAPMMIAMKLNSNQKFSDAQKWFKYIFDPTAVPTSNDGELKYLESHHWKFLPFRNYTIESLVKMLQNKQEISVYNNEPFDPHAIARLRLGAYEKSAVMACIDNIIDWGDYLFSQYTWESITEATMLYIYAYDLLGVKPRDLGKYKTQKPATFEEINKKYQNDIPQFLIDLENVLSSSPDTGVPGTKKPFNDIYTYFSVPGNTQFMSYWDTVEDRLFKIRHSLNIKGEKELLALFEPEIDPIELARAVGADNSLLGASSYLQTAVPYYRFDYMLSKAKEITSAVIQLGASLLNALEKNDAEAMSILSSTHELNILNMTTMQKEKQIEDELKNIEGLNENLNSAKNRYNTYKKYIDNGLNGCEIESQELKKKAVIPMGISAAIHGVSIAGYLSAKIFGLAAGGMQFGDAINAGSAIADGIAQMLNQVASIIEVNGQYARRKDDWTLEMKSAEYEVNQIQKTIESAKIQKDIAKQELAIHLKSIEQSKEMESFLKSKFTSKDLYNWMVARVSAIYFQTFKLALDLSLKAQRAYQYEIASNDSFINYGYWDSLKKGLLAGESLMYSLQQMDKSYIENNPHILEIEKTISLLQLNPLAFIEFKSTGQCSFNLDEELYDYDFPGHYCRKIQSISVSIPAVVGPYQNVNATFTQTSNSVIIEPDGDAVEYMLKRGDNTTSKPGPDVLRENWTMNQKVAITKGIDDSGMFVLDFNDERYVPFEGTGAVSSWKLSMPRETNRIDFNTISDVIIKIKYTAVDGGESFASEVKDKLSSTGRKYVVFKHFDLKQEFQNNWHAFINGNRAEDKQTLKFTIPENVMLKNVQNALMKSVYFKLSTPEDMTISNKSGKGSFVHLTVKDTSISNVDVTMLKNIGMADEEQVKDVSGFTGEWRIEFDLNKIPTELLLDGAINPESLKDIELIIVYEVDPFGN
jgi:hypothetical protein